MSLCRVLGSGKSLLRIILLTVILRTDSLLIGILQGFNLLSLFLNRVIHCRIITESHFAERHYTECNFAQSLSSKCHSTKCLCARGNSANCHCTKCRGSKFSKGSLNIFGVIYFVKDKTQQKWPEVAERRRYK